MKPDELTPRAAASRYLDNRRPEVTEETFSTYHYRLKLFVEWCESEGIETVAELDGWLLDEFRSFRAGQGLASSSLHNEMDTLRLFAEYLDRIGATDDLADRIDVPEVPEGERSRETMLEPDRALELLRKYRDEGMTGSRFHVVLELFWHTGARLGAIRGLDIQDFDDEDGVLWFRHRPETGTPLKKKRDGERPISIHSEVVDVIREYVDEHRPDGHDEYGRNPLLVTVHHNRPSKSAIRSWMYKATLPCRFVDCPHGYEKSSCDFRVHGSESRCPSSRAPHHVRTGSLTWHRDRGYPMEALASRVNAAEETIAEYYDKATKRKRMEQRRRSHTEKLSLTDDTE